MTMYVITHKKFNYSLPDGFKTLLVGANKNANPDNYLADNTGDNISDKNSSYCELTGLYWMWKNTSDDKVGLCHYRRYFSNFRDEKSLKKDVLLHGTTLPASIESLDKDLEDHDWVVAAPVKCNYGSIIQDFNTYHHAKDMKITREVVNKLYPEFIEGFDKAMKLSAGSYYNMFYTTHEKFDGYCKWLFEILSEVEKRVDISGYDNYQQRLFGFLSERLFNVYLEATNAKVAYRYVFQTDETGRYFIFKNFVKSILAPFRNK
ncbi:MAG: DUF4422 domain-containing protein [Limosilactobacillus sp.]|uniref:DUF4422 domain-containing protein n=1 Tax=Limosilactobacillus sp. TaxID=2773925 RepID=UPI0026F5D222|nr:DUF4422 domain-containing protein [Limosilactobacillus sp.]